MQQWYFLIVSFLMLCFALYTVHVSESARAYELTSLFALMCGMMFLASLIYFGLCLPGGPK